MYVRGEEAADLMMTFMQILRPLIQQLYAKATAATGAAAAEARKERESKKMKNKRTILRPILQNANNKVELLDLKLATCFVCHI